VNNGERALSAASRRCAEQTGNVGADVKGNVMGGKATARKKLVGASTRACEVVIYPLGGFEAARV